MRVTVYYTLLISSRASIPPKKHGHRSPRRLRFNVRVWNFLWAHELLHDSYYRLGRAAELD